MGVSRRLSGSDVEVVLCVWMCGLWSREKRKIKLLKGAFMWRAFMLPKVTNQPLVGNTGVCSSKIVCVRSSKFQGWLCPNCTLLLSTPLCSVKAHCLKDRYIWSFFKFGFKFLQKSCLFMRETYFCFRLQLGIRQWQLFLGARRLPNHLARFPRNLLTPQNMPLQL